MNITEKSFIQKACAILIIIALTISDFLFVGTTIVSYALDVVNTNNSNVEFSAYFLNTNGEKVERLEENIDKGEQYLYVDVSVKNEGYFNGTITIGNSNFNLKQEKLSTEIAEISGNTVTLNQINAGSTVTIKLGIEPTQQNTIEQETLDKQAEIQLTGQYVNSKNVEKEKHIEIEGTTTVEMKWKSSESSKAELASSMLTNAVYQIGGEAKRIVQIRVDSNITNNNYPVKNTQIELSVPENVQEVSVHARSTAATNSTINFGQENYTYDETSKKLTIELANEDLKQVSWNKNVQDTLIVTYVFNQEENVMSQEITINSKINTYDDKELTASQNVHIEKEIDGILSHLVETTENEIYKGKLYTGEARDYTTTSRIYIDYLNVVDGITIEANESTYVANDQEQAANIIYKQTKINKNEFLKILGEEGYMTITDAEGNQIANIDKDAETDENGNIVIQYAEATKSIEITTSTPIALGTLNIENTKTIQEAGYARDSIKSLTGIREKSMVNGTETTKTITLKETETVADLSLDVQTISTIADNQEITLEATLIANDESKDLYKNPDITITFPREITVLSAKYAALYKNGLEVQESTTSQNENGQYQIHLKFTGEQAKYDTVGGTKIYLKVETRTNKLTPSKASAIEMTYTNENKNETKTTSAEFNFESQYGLMIYNQMENYNKAGEAMVTVDSEPVTGTIDINTESREVTIGTAIINNYGQDMSNVVLIGTIPAGTSDNEFKANINQVQTNNSNATIYYSTNRDATPEDESWGEYTEDAVAYKIEIPEMAKEAVTQIKISATLPENIGYNESGAFETTTYCNYQNQEQTNTSSMVLATKANIAASSPEMIETQTTESGLNTEITAFIGNDSLAENDNVFEGQIIKYQITITNNTGRDYNNVTIGASQKNGYVWDIIAKEEYNAFYQETATEYFYELTDSNTIELGKIQQLKNGESYTYVYETTVYGLDNEAIDGETTYGTITITSEEDQLNDSITTRANPIQPAKLNISLIKTYNLNREWENDGDTSALLTIENTAESTLTDVEVKIAYPNTTRLDISLNEPSSSKISYQGETEENGVKIGTFQITSIEVNEKIEINLYPYIGEDTEQEENELWILAVATTADEEIYVSNKLERTIYDDSHNIQINQQVTYEDGTAIDLNNDKLNDGDKVKFTATVTNQEEMELNVNIEYNLDAMINIENATIVGAEAQEQNILDQIVYNNISQEEKTIKPGETITLTVVGTIDALEIDSVTSTLHVYDNESGKLSESNLSISVNKLAETTDPEEETETVDEGTVEEPEVEVPDEPEEPDEENPDEEEPQEGNETNTTGNETGNGNETADGNTTGEEPSEEPGETPNPEEDPETPNGNDNQDVSRNRYTISGIVWLDQDKDGKRSESEQKMADIEVNAINTETGEIAATARTNSNGEYTFNLVEGNYMIVFYYDNNLYTTTTYQANGIAETENSDAIGREITVNGTTQTAGTTDTLTLNQNLTNVDIGLIQRNTFDLEIHKYVSKITVTNDAQTRTYEQEDATTLAKAEIRGKYLSGSLVVIEYKIQVSNVGDVAGYARNIIDYMPSTLNFNSSMNADWYLSGNNLYNTSLANTKIEPGETKELTLVLTKTMTESNTGLINNQVEISESSNQLGITDETKNKGSADVILSVTTGALVNYVLITLSSVVVLAILAYIVNKKYLSKRI